jgi:Zincin-like metallopeptidase
VRRADFESMVRRMTDEIPPEFLDGVAEITVSPRTVPHPARPDVYTLGECLALPAGLDEPDQVQSRVVLYYGSFAALARQHPGFDWRAEAWETLTHEIRHHVEWRARVPDLEALDRAAEQNFARIDGEPFDPTFYRDGERLPDGVYRVEDDYFIELAGPVTAERDVAFRWAGRGYAVLLPDGLEPPAFLAVTGVVEPPPGDLMLVFPPPGGLRGLLRARSAARYDVSARSLEDGPTAD